MRAAMVTAVRSLAATDGWQSVSIRKIADRIEYSPTLLYQYFDSKEAVIHEVRRQGYAQLLACMTDAAASPGNRATDPEANATLRLKLMARANIDCAFAQPEVFKAMLGMDGTPCDPPADDTSPARIAMLIRETIAAASLGATTTIHVGQDAEAFFAAVQGVVTMYLNDLIPGGHHRALEIVDRLVDGLARGWFS
jgi:AcrR family transcriptional regulator